MVVRRRARLVDKFEGTVYSLADGATSANGKWWCDYTGAGTVGTRIDNQRTSSKIMALDPSLPQEGDPGFTRACKIDALLDVYDFECTFDMKTMAQNKATPNNWEVAWFMWHFTDDWHHYYMLIQRDGGLEVGRKDYAIQQEQQQFLVTNDNSSPTFTMGQWYNVKVRQVGFNIKIWINGVQQCNITDDGTFGWDSATGTTPPAPTAAMRHGYCGFYCEDSESYYDNFVLRAL